MAAMASSMDSTLATTMSPVSRLVASLCWGDALLYVPVGFAVFFAGMVEGGLTGRTGEGGFYRTGRIRPGISGREL